MSKYLFQFGLFDRFWSHFWTHPEFGHFLVTILETFLDTFWSHFWTLNGHIFGQIWGLEKKFGHFFDHILVTILETFCTHFGHIFGHFMVTFLDRSGGWKNDLGTSLVTIVDKLVVWTLFGHILVTFLDTFEFGHFLVTFWTLFWTLHLHKCPKCVQPYILVQHLQVTLYHFLA